jgi:hypothetical protein
MVFSSVSIAPYGDAVSEAEGRAGWGRDMPALSYAERLSSPAAEGSPVERRVGVRSRHIGNSLVQGHR